MDSVKVSNRLAFQAQALSVLEQLFYRHDLYLYKHCAQNYLERSSAGNIHSKNRARVAKVASQSAAMGVWQ
jgi:hypothetical protein